MLQYHLDFKLKVNVYLKYWNSYYLYNIYIVYLYCIKHIVEIDKYDDQIRSYHNWAAQVSYR